MRVIFIRLLLVCSCLTAYAQSAVRSIVLDKKGEVDLTKTNDIASSGSLREMPQQGREKEGPRSKSFVFERQAVSGFQSPGPDYSPRLLIRQMPKQSASKVIQTNYPAQPVLSKEQAAPTLPTPIKGQSFFGNHFNVSTPCDNDLAISDSGIVMSAMNTTAYFRNTKTNQILPGKSLAAFTNPINNFHEEFDPKVMYDPSADRFVFVCMVGNHDTTSKVIVGFSQTNMPNGLWNLYALPGDATNDSLWSDYPMIAMTQKELFLSINLLKNNSTWQAGFVETIVWQIDKKKGYLGQSMAANLHSNIKYNGKAIRNLCPVKGGSQLYGPNMYFISNRNLDSQNDTVFLVNITDTINASTNTITTKALTSNLPYVFPPDGRQALATQSLATNDSRNLGAFLENNKIQYVHNTKNPANNFSTIYYGVIDNPSSTAPTVTGYLIPNDTMDFAYPNISYAGNSSIDNTSIITFDHSSDKVFAGVSAIQADALGNFSNVLRIQNGQNYVNLLVDNLERWGDYSGSQRRYNKPGEVWMSGYYGYLFSNGYPKCHGAWVAQIKTHESVITAVPAPEAGQASANVFPNPVVNRMSVAFSLPKPEYLSFELYDAQGKLVAVLLRDWVKVTENSFSFNTSDLEKGIYVLKITGNYQTNISKKIVIN